MLKELNEKTNSLFKLAKSMKRMTRMLKEEDV